MQVDIVTGEVVDAEIALSASAARALTDRIRQTLTVGHDLLIQAFTGGAWIALGYETWDAYCQGEFTEARMVKLDREQRREFVAEMRAAGMSSRAIASGLGVDHVTVLNDGRATGETSPVAPKPIIGVNGKTYQPSAPKPAAEPPVPRRSALPDQAMSAGWELRKAVERVERISADDRFNSHKELMAAHLRGHLIHAVEVCQDVLDRITPEES